MAILIHIKHNSETKFYFSSTINHWKTRYSHHKMTETINNNNILMPGYSQNFTGKSKQMITHFVFGKYTCDASNLLHVQIVGIFKNQYIFDLKMSLIKMPVIKKCH